MLPAASEAIVTQITTHCNTTAHLSIVAEHVNPFMITVHPFSDGCFQQDHTLTGFFNKCSLYSNDLYSHQIPIQ